MFLRSTNRRKDGKDHRYFSIVENRRLPGGKTAQRKSLRRVPAIVELAVQPQALA